MGKELIVVSINRITFDITEQIVKFDYSKTGSIKIYGEYKDTYIPIKNADNYTLVFLNNESKMIFITEQPNHNIAKPIFLQNILENSIYSIAQLKGTIIKGEKRIEQIKKMLNII